MPKKNTTKKAGKRASQKLEPTLPRRLKRSNYRSFKLSKKIKHPQPLAGSYKMFMRALGVLKNNWRLFLKLGVIYGLLTIVLVKGFGSTNLSELKDLLNDTFGGSFGSLATGATLFSYLLGTSGSSTMPAGSAYQSMLITIMSLAVIWALRQIIAGNKVRAKEAFYQGLYPLVPFVLVLIVIGFQLVPLAVGSWLYSTVVNNGIAVFAAEKVAWATLFFLLAVLSLYMLCSSVFALYIVTLPNMTPLKALRSARQLVLHRRWTILRKILFLPLVLLVIGGLITIPLVLYLTPVAEWAFFTLSMAALIIAHAYMYSLYRELL